MVVRHILTTHRNLIGFKLNRCDNYLLFNVCSVEVICWECCRMVLLLVAVCWFRENRYKASKWTFYQILHQNRVQNIFQCNYNNIEKKICVLKIYVIVLRTIFDTTYPKKLVEIYIWALHHKLVLFLQSRIFFNMYQRTISKGTSWDGPRCVLFISTTTQLIHLLVCSKE